MTAAVPGARSGATVGIPDTPTPADLDRVLARLTLIEQLTLDEIWTNKEECLRLRGTPGEPIPEFEERIDYEQRVIWDDAEPLAPEDRRMVSLGRAAALYGTCAGLLRGLDTGKSNFTRHALMRIMEERKRATQPVPRIICINSEYTPEYTPDDFV